jgi:hypothetical protein
MLHCGLCSAWLPGNTLGEGVNTLVCEKCGARTSFGVTVMSVDLPVIELTIVPDSDAPTDPEQETWRDRPPLL